MTPIKNTIEAAELQNKLFTATAPTVIDVRKVPAFEQSGSIIPTASWQNYLHADSWGQTLPSDIEIVLYCVHGHQVSQAATTILQSAGKNARYLRGGFAAWQDLNRPTLAIQAWQEHQFKHWLTLESPSIKRIACYWLIRRFINPLAIIHRVDQQYSDEIARECQAISFEIGNINPDLQASACTLSFASLIEQLEITDPLLSRMSRIISAAAAKDYSTEPEAAGLGSVLRGIANMHNSSWDCFSQALLIFDALYSECNQRRQNSV
ncbi:MAG: chromate resistance protein [Pseudomonadales bacterium]|nr:chromate resistance protein [Pseudomonadales bacterium]NRA17432.1 chromate resistance protein [Oceanospirillaceae bacterium]